MRSDLFLKPDLVSFFAFMLILVCGCNTANAGGFQPRVYLPAPELYMDDSYIGPDTFPVKAFVKTQASQPVQVKQLQPTQTVKQVQANQELITRPAQNIPAIATQPKKKDTALIRLLYDGFKPKTKSSIADRIKIRQIIDSVVSKKDDQQTSTGSAGADYQTLVRIIDSLLKANKIEAEKALADSPLVKKTDSVIVNRDDQGNKQVPEKKMFWWLIAAGVLVVAGLAFFVLKRKRGAGGQARIFFSYAWDQDEALIMQLYSSLKKDGFNVIKDKENMGYKGVISKFMNEIGSADYVIVAISDKYLRSKFCMYELYELYKNSGMNPDKFSKKLFPIRIDESLNLGDPDTVNVYVRYWQDQEIIWAKRMKEESETITEEQARQYQFVKRLVIDVRNIVSCLADINSLNLTTLKSNDFADIKSALSEAIEAKHS